MEYLVILVLLLIGSYRLEAIKRYTGNKKLPTLNVTVIFHN